MDEEMIYDAVLGELTEKIHDVESKFLEGSKCSQLYEEIDQARCRICERLGVDEDTDLELIIDNFFEMNREIGMQMYRYGKKLG